MPGALFDFYERREVDLNLKEASGGAKRLSIRPTTVEFSHRTYFAYVPPALHQRKDVAVPPSGIRVHIRMQAVVRVDRSEVTAALTQSFRTRENGVGAAALQCASQDVRHLLTAATGDRVSYKNARVLTAS